MSRGALLSAAALMAASLPSMACPPLPAAAAAKVSEAVAAVDDAIRRSHRAALEPLVAPGYEQVLGNGERVDRRRFVEALTSGPGAQFTVSHDALCGWADIAIVTFDAEFAVGDAAAPRTVSTFIVDVYRRQSQRGKPRWQLAFDQIGVRR